MRKCQLLNLQDLQIYVYVWGGALAPWAASTGLDRPEQCPLPPLGGAPIESLSLSYPLHEFGQVWQQLRFLSLQKRQHLCLTGPLSL